MKTVISFILVILNLSLCIAQESNWSEVESVFGKKGAVQDGVFKITFPRSDLKIRVGDFSVAPGFALTTWVGFLKAGENSMMMGDLVLLDEEVAPVISKIVSENLEVTAVHNHLVGETPNVKYIHFAGKGDAVKLAGAIKSVLAVTGTPLTLTPAETQGIKPDWSKVEAVLGKSGKQNGNIIHFGFPRAENITENGMALAPFIGVGTAINFQMEGSKAGITGDFVLLADEVNQVVKALTSNGISVTALHNHMLYENPRLFMMHFWAVDDPVKLAKGIKAAIDKTNSKK